MKIYDSVKVIKDDETYKQNGIYKGMIGTIILPEIRDNCFYVNFIDENFKIHKDDYDWFRLHYKEIKDDIFCIIKIEDLEVVEDGNATDEMILEELPKNNPKWWCKAEDGFIVNLLGEKKNKIAYDYNS